MPAKAFRSSCHIPANLLNAQGYVVEVTMYSAQYTDWYILKDVLRFEVTDSPELRNDYFREYLGAVRPDLRWETTPASGSGLTLVAG